MSFAEDNGKVGMIYILVKLSIVDLHAFDTFERQAIVIMSEHSGELIAAFETHSDATDELFEHHLLRFPNRESFAAYQADKRLAALKELRSRAIASTEVVVSDRIKDYNREIGQD